MRPDVGPHFPARCSVTPCVPLLPRAITLDNTLVILSTVAPDAGRYYVQAVNDKNGDNKTSQPVTLTVQSKMSGCRMRRLGCRVKCRGRLRKSGYRERRLGAE